MNEFKEYIQRLANRALPNPLQEQEVIRNYGDRQLEKYGKFHENPYVRDYFNHLVAAIMISQYENYEQSGINIPYRYKARKSTRDKVDKRLKKATVHYNENGDIIVDNVDPLLDIFAMEIVSRRRPTVTTSNNPEIQQLLDEQKRNQEDLERFQGFKRKLLIDDLKPPKSSNLRFDCTQVEYYEMCRGILSKLKDIVHPNATVLKEHYDNQLSIIEQRLSFLESSPESQVTLEDFKDNSLNFFSLLSEFESRLYNKTELAVLTKQITSLFDNNPIFEKLGVSLSNMPVEEKRTENGFESNFIYLDTPVGRVECQLQTESQYRFGNFGFAAHTKLSGKNLETVKIPQNVKPKLKEKVEEVKEFISKIRDISPDTYLARMDDNERGRVMTIEFGDYQNYKKVISQVADGDPSERFLYNYFSKLYALRDSLFDKEERSLGFIKTDIEEYIGSDDFKHFLEIAPTLNKDTLNIQDIASHGDNDNSEEER